MAYSVCFNYTISYLLYAISQRGVEPPKVAYVSDVLKNRPYPERSKHKWNARMIAEPGGFVASIQFSGFSRKLYGEKGGGTPL
ncbi:hypothetical protein AMJ52_05595 [candidate division TA06 bacterium DG_78]|uniref:Uncharacterized protein n=1 Tax=candidate division TA06 bacterium DG_78 TaxID=1703772 RepID=A0A0S7YD08_UNCT6|nr:MAG: hypothetical protein AMJ52_05595 [candidate division TA06 bacterium DG_78]